MIEKSVILRQGRAPWWILVVPGILYAIIAILRLNFPGLHFDELLFANAALGGLDDTFIYKKIFDVPFLLMPYIGALKSFVMAPVFALFGVSVASIRLPMIVITAIAIFGLGKLLSRWIGGWPASITCLLLALDPSLISLTRADSGPVVLQFALTVIALAFIDRYIRTKKFDSLIGLWMALGLLVFNKLNGIWIVNAVVLALAVVYGRSLWRDIKGLKRTTHLISHIVGYLLVSGWYLIVSYKFELFTFLQPGSFDFGARIANISSTLYGLASGELYYEYLFGAVMFPGAAIVVVGTALVFVAGIVAALIGKNSDRKPYLFFLITTLAVFAQIVITRNAVWPWHYACLYPFVTCTIVAGLLPLIRHRSINRLLRTTVFAVIILLIITNTRYVLAYGKPTKNVYWSTAIYDLYDKVSRLAGEVISVDWGTHTQLLTLSQNAHKYKNASFFINRDPLPSDAREIAISEWISVDPSQPQKNRYYVMHTEASTLFGSARKNFFELSASNGLKPELLQTISDGDNPVFEIYQLVGL